MIGPEDYLTEDNLTCDLSDCTSKRLQESYKQMRNSLSELTSKQLRESQAESRKVSSKSANKKVQQERGHKESRTSLSDSKEEVAEIVKETDDRDSLSDCTSKKLQTSYKQSRKSFGAQVSFADDSSCTSSVSIQSSPSKASSDASSQAS